MSESLSTNSGELICKICRLCFGGSLPAAHDELFIDAVMAALRRTVLDGEPRDVLDCFRDGLRHALADLRAAEAVEQAARWQN